MEERSRQKKKTVVMAARENKKEKYLFLADWNTVYMPSSRA